MFLIFRRFKKDSIPCRIRLSEEEICHVNSRRLRVGDPIFVGDGRGSRWPARLQEDVKQIEIMGPPSHKTEKLRLLCTALPEPKRLEKQLLPAAVELGMSHLQPITYEYSLPHAISLSRARRIMDEAAAQSQRFFLPRILETKLLSSLHIFLLRLKLPKSNIIVPHPEAELSMGEYLKQHTKLPKQGMAILLGPEGGFSPREIEEFKSYGYPILGLGGNLLRVATAGLASLARLID